MRAPLAPVPGAAHHRLVKVVRPQVVRRRQAEPGVHVPRLAGVARRGARRLPERVGVLHLAKREQVGAARTVGIAVQAHRQRRRVLQAPAEAARVQRHTGVAQGGEEAGDGVRVDPREAQRVAVGAEEGGGARAGDGGAEAGVVVVAPGHQLAAPAHPEDGARPLPAQPRQRGVGEPLHRRVEHQAGGAARKGASGRDGGRQLRAAESAARGVPRRGRHLQRRAHVARQVDVADVEAVEGARVLVRAQPKDGGPLRRHLDSGDQRRQRVQAPLAARRDVAGRELGAAGQHPLTVAHRLPARRLPPRRADGERVEPHPSAAPDLHAHRRLPLPRSEGDAGLRRGPSRHAHQHLVRASVARGVGGEAPPRVGRRARLGPRAHVRHAHLRPRDPRSGPVHHRPADDARRLLRRERCGQRARCGEEQRENEGAGHGEAYTIAGETVGPRISEDGGCGRGDERDHSKHENYSG